MDPDTKEILRVRVARVQDRYQGHSLVFRVLWVVVGATVLIAGLVMTVLPGPAIVVVPVGMAMLAAEFAWARKLLALGIDRGVDAKRRMQRAHPATKLLGLLAVLCLAGAVAAVFVLR